MSKKRKKQKQKPSSKTLTVRLPEEPWQAREQLTQLADELGCPISTLVWHSIEQMLMNPPTTAPTPITKSTKGFWVKVKLSIFRYMIGVEVREVRKRNALKAGRYFFTWEGGKEENTNRYKAYRLAKAKAYELLNTLGFTNQPPTFTLLNQLHDDNH